MSPMNDTCDVLISGAGVPGLALAILLGELGLKVILIDPHPPTPLRHVALDGRTVALMAGSINILKATGAWDHCAPHGSALQTLRIIEGKTQVYFHAGDIGLDYFGINIPNAILRSALADRARKIRTVHLIESGLQNFSSDDFGITATLDHAQNIRARLLIGADGRNSKARTLANITAKEHLYGQHAITCLISHSKPHHNVSIEFHRPGGPFTLVPMPGNMSSVVWVEYDNDAEQLIRLRKDDFERALQERTENMLGTIACETPLQSSPLKSLRAQTLIAPRLALMAEAAHVVHPLGAQGLNLSLRDTAAAAEEIADAARSGQDIGSRYVLERYQFRRRADILTRCLGTNGLTKMVSNDIGLLKALRSAGLKTVDAIEPLRRFAMHEGVTPGYDDSRLSRGLDL